MIWLSERVVWQAKLQQITGCQMWAHRQVYIKQL